MTGTNGSGVAADIAVGDIDGRGKPSILVADELGSLRVPSRREGPVEKLLFYHPCTKVGILSDGGSSIKIAAGNVYHTPLNVVSPADGRFLAHLGTMRGRGLFDDRLLRSPPDRYGLPGHGRRRPEGDRFRNEVQSRLCPGRGGRRREVDGRSRGRGHRRQDDDGPGDGEASILAATDAGELVKLDRRGHRSAWLKLSHILRTWPSGDPGRGAERNRRVAPLMEASSSAIGTCSSARPRPVRAPSRRFSRRGTTAGRSRAPTASRTRPRLC